MDDKRVRHIHLLWRDHGSCMAPMTYHELAGMMRKALEQLQRFSLASGCSVHQRSLLRWSHWQLRMQLQKQSASSVRFLRRSAKRHCSWGYSLR